MIKNHIKYTLTTHNLDQTIFFEDCPDSTEFLRINSLYWGNCDLWQGGK